MSSIQMDVHKLMEKMLLNPEPNEEGDGTDQMVDAFVSEYSNLDSAMDQINSCLDDMEKQNDDIVVQLQELLVESRATREAFKAERLAKESEDGKHKSDSDAGGSGTGAGGDGSRSSEEQGAPADPGLDDPNCKSKTESCENEESEVITKPQERTEEIPNSDVPKHNEKL